MKIPVLYTGLCALLVIATALTAPRKQVDDCTIRVSGYIKSVSPDLIASTRALQKAVEQLEAGQPASVIKAKRALLLCRLQYKRVAFLLDYFFPGEASVFNAPPKYEVDEPDMEYQHPVGLQVIESLLYSAITKNNKIALLQQAQLVVRSAEALPALLYQFKATNQQVLESTKLELLRVMTLYIAGYDAPQLKSGTAESAIALLSISNILNPYIQRYNDRDSILSNIQYAIQYLQSSKDFNSFNRLVFLTDCALPLQRKLNSMAIALNLQLNTVPALNANAPDIFDANALNKNAFNGTQETDTIMINLGKELFFEKALSGDGSRSCASCHNPGKYFTDGLAKNTMLNNQGRLVRNTPTLLYAVYQYSQFWDGRAKTIEQQAGVVLHNSVEMNVTDDTVIGRLKRQPLYIAGFKKCWPNDSNFINMQHLATSITVYIKTLAPFKSAFDRYISGDHKALTTQQQTGFNLFMGKAACGTCHFAPLFNGLTPPLYNKTEYEVAGTTLTDNFTKPEPDNDSGRYKFFPIIFYMKAFKTPTVRNAAVTGPYMHNGAFKSLASVVEFYNKGGGQGLGLNEPNQTLPYAPLHLTEDEKKCLVAFMESLTD